MATPNYGLPVLSGTETYSLKTIHNALSNSVDAALKVVANGGVPRVNNATERNAIFAVPVQGNAVFRKDLGWEETYYALFNSGTNPGGAISAGWYPTAGRLPYAAAYRPTAIALTATPTAFTYTTFGGYSITAAATTITITQPGRYSCSANLQAGTGGSAMVYGELRKNDATFPQISGLGAASQTSSSDYNSFLVSGIGNFAAGDTIKFYAWGSTSLTAGGAQCRLDVQYIGPA